MQYSDKKPYYREYKFQTRSQTWNKTFFTQTRHATLCGCYNQVWERGFRGKRGGYFSPPFSMSRPGNLSVKCGQGTRARSTFLLMERFRVAEKRFMFVVMFILPTCPVVPFLLLLFWCFDSFLLVFSHLLGGGTLVSPLIWECTRFCLNRGAGRHVAAALMLGGGEVMQNFSVEHFVGVF